MWNSFLTTTTNCSTALIVEHSKISKALSVKEENLASHIPNRLSSGNLFDWYAWRVAWRGSPAAGG
jgi:hypothetical protein